MTHEGVGEGGEAPMGEGRRVSPLVMEVRASPSPKESPPPPAHGREPPSPSHRTGCLLGAVERNLPEFRERWADAHHANEIAAAILAHELLLAAAALDDAPQAPIEHDVGAVRAVALPGVGSGSDVGRGGCDGAGAASSARPELHLYKARPASTAVQSMAKSIWRTKGDILAATVCAALSTTLGCARMILGGEAGARGSGEGGWKGAPLGSGKGRRWPGGGRRWAPSCLGKDTGHPEG